MKSENQIISTTLQVVLLVVVFLCNQIPLSAQDSPTVQPRIKHYTLEDGLSQVTPQDLICDKNGIVWIATADGLNRFDGTDFIHYKNDESDSTSISGNQIQRVFEDSRGAIWAGTNWNGLNYLDPSTNSFRRIPLLHGNELEERVTGIDEDSSGSIWVTSRLTGLHRLDSSDQYYSQQSNYLPNNPLSILLLDDETVWLGSFDGQLYKMSISTPNDSNVELMAESLGHIQSLYLTTSHLLIGSDIGFFMYDLNTSEIEKIELDYSGLVYTRHVLDFLKFDATSIWIATGNGLYLFDWKLRTVQKSIDNASGLSSNTVHALLEIDSGQYYVGTANYLNFIDFTQPYFNTISKNKKGQHILSDNVIFSVLKDEIGLWVGTSDGGINLIMGDQVYYYSAENYLPNSVAGSTIRAIVKDDVNQRIWIGTTRGLILLQLKGFNPENPKFVVFNHDPNSTNSISSDFLKDIVLDKQNNVWGATYGEGIFRLELDNNGQHKIYIYKNDPENTNSLINNFGQSIKVDNNNDIWVGTQDGLSHFNNSSKHHEAPNFVNYYKDNSIENSLSHNSIYDIVIDESNRMWLGTRHGLNLFTGNNTFKSWTEQDQMPNAIIYSIQNDNNNQLWLGTNDGLVRFDPTKGEFALYNVEDGIQSPEFDIHTKFRDEDGVIYMGGIAGLTYFQPERLKDMDKSVPLYFSKLRVKDKSDQSLDNLNEIILHPTAESFDLEFDYNQFPFYIDFSAIDHTINKNVTYAYQLEPHDEAWNILNDNEVQFLNLNPGEYRLKVNGFSRGKEWDQAPLEMKLTIHPPWWFTIWAYLSYCFLILGAGYLFYRFSLSRKLAVAESQKLKELDSLKDRFYSNITHEFRTPLTVISGMADELGVSLKKDPHKKINLIKRNSQSLLALVNQMLDLSKLQAGKATSNYQQSDIISFLKYISESHQSLAKLKDIGLQFYSEEESLLMDYDAFQLEQTLNNLIGNAVKFTNEYGNILIVAKKCTDNGPSELEIKVKDTGIGIAPDQLPHIFNRFHQVDPIHGNQGSGIGLALVKELMILMNGRISVESELNEGTTFLLRLPINNKAQIPAEPATRKVVKQIRQQYGAENINEIIDDSLPIVLLIEDNQDVTYYLKSCLENEYQIVSASNGKIGIERAFEVLPDLIISDVMMPEMDGFEVCHKLKNDHRTNHIPIILLTAKATSEDKISGLSYGADAYLIKPFKRAELLVRIENLMEIRQTLQAKYSSTLISSQEAREKPLSKEEIFIQRLEELILTNLDDEDFSIQKISREIALSKSQTSRKIKALTGMSTSIFIRHIRLQRAKQILLISDKTISEVAYEVGFKTPTYFSQSFKEYFGHSPSATRLRTII